MLSLIPPVVVGDGATVISGQIEVTCRYRETTAMGMAGEASYLPWLELGRAALLRDHGMDYRQFESEGYLVPIFSVGAKFFRPVVYDDVLTIITKLPVRPTIRFRLEYEIHCHGLVATAYTVQGFINRSHRPVRPPASFTAAVDRAFPPAG